jgi:hypothetical protein
MLGYMVPESEAKSEHPKQLEASYLPRAHLDKVSPDVD